MPVLPSDRNQSIDLHSKSINWFLYEGKFLEFNGLKLWFEKGWHFCNIKESGWFLKSTVQKQSSKQSVPEVSLKCGMVSTNKVCRSSQSMIFTH